jgi:hypothetical protein
MVYMIHRQWLLQEKVKYNKLLSNSWKDFRFWLCGLSEYIIDIRKCLASYMFVGNFLFYIHIVTSCFYPLPTIRFIAVHNIPSCLLFQ